ncbi:MAG: SEL1-like repeat protein, partial [Muribaculaceae bacterium]|nr:SEL1-like repeat protein [Muribaculaceae bacterium]
YYYGEGVTQDYSKATKWLTKAAENGNDNAKKILNSLKEKAY